MGMKEWAEREVKIACERERKASNKEDELFDYGSACYESALKVFNKLLEDGHSGMSIIFTKNILNRLIEGKPLTDITDVDENWSDITDMYEERECEVYQCNRMGSLFKYKYKDGSVKYSDVNMTYCVNIHNPNDTYHSGLARRIIDEMLPITMPYYPKSPIKVYCEEFLTDEKNGDFDTMGIFHAVTPDGEHIDINRFFYLGDDKEQEIDTSTYNKLQSKKIK